MARTTLLPANRTAFEEAFDLTGARIDELPVDSPKLVRPAQIPSSHLPWLAWGLSVDLWEPDWSEEKHRGLAAWSLPLHARKGTQAAIAEHIRIMGAEPRRFSVPPAKTYLGRNMTADEREAFLARFAQLRIYPFVARGFYRFANFTTVANGRTRAFLNNCHAIPVGAWSRYTRTAKLWDRGEETTLTIRAVTPEGVGRFAASEYDEVVLGPKPSAALYANAPPKAQSFLIDDFGVARRIVRIARAASYAYRLGRETYTTIRPNGELIDVRPQMVAEQHAGHPTALYITRGQFTTGKCLPPSIAWRFIYERWYLHDPDRVPDARKAATFIGTSRLGLPAYHAEAQVRITSRAAQRAVQRHLTGFFVPRSRKGLADVREAIRVSKSLRDKVLINTTTVRLPRAGDRFKVGSLTLGRYIEV